MSRISRTHSQARARPDEKMGRLHMPWWWDGTAGRFSSTQRKMEKKAAAKKRRQRDKTGL